MGSPSLKNANFHNNKNIFLFFVDKDFSEYATGGYEYETYENDDFFKTEFYSLENYFINTKILEQIIYYFLPEKTKNEKKTILENFKKEFEKFTEWHKSIMALASIVNKNSEKNIELDNLRGDKYFNKLEPKFKNKKILEEYNNEMQISEKTINNRVKDFKKEINTYLRGKNALHRFFKNFVGQEGIKAKYLDIKILILIYHNTGKIPDNLKKYLENNHKKLKEWQN